MDLGVGPFTCRQLPDIDQDTSTLYTEMVELAQLVESVGLDSAWVSEHHFVEDGYLSGTMPALGAISGVTDNIEIGTCVALAPFHHPVTLAENAATLDLISKGRLTLGLGLGYRDQEFDGFGREKSERVERLEDLVRFLRCAWDEEYLDYESRFFDVSPDVRITPKPEHGITIALAGKAKPAVRRAGRIGDGWIATTSTSLDGLRRRREDIEGSQHSESDGFNIYVGAQGFVAEDSETAWETMKDGYFYTRRRNLEFHSGETIRDLPIDTKRELKDQAIYGSPAEVSDQINAYRDVLGEDIHFIFRIFHPGIERDHLEDCIRLLGEEVAPRIRE